MALIFTIGNETVRAHDGYFEKKYRDSGLGFGDVSLDAIRSFIDADQDKLQVSDIVTEWERDLSRIGFALYEGKNRGVETVGVSALGSQ